MNIFSTLPLSVVKQNINFMSIFFSAFRLFQPPLSLGRRETAVRWSSPHWPPPASWPNLHLSNWPRLVIFLNFLPRSPTSILRPRSPHGWKLVFGGWCCGEVCQLTARSAAIVSSCGAGGRGWWPPTLLWLGLPAHLPTMLPTPIYYDMLWHCLNPPVHSFSHSTVHQQWSFYGLKVVKGCLKWSM